MVGLSEQIATLVRRSRLRLYGHVLKRNEDVGIRRALEFEVEDMTGRGRPLDGENKGSISHCFYINEHGSVV